MQRRVRAMKPHEETWVNADESEGWGGIDLVSTQEDVAQGDPHRIGVGEFDTPERRRLAAQAPAMARKLLELIYDDINEGLLPTWEIEAVLRDAGVIP